MALSPTKVNGSKGNGPVEKVRLLVVGDSGVGKSCFVHQICHGMTLKTPTWTVGCHTDVKLHSCTVDGRERNFILEFWEVGGHRNFKPGRRMFYQNMNGVIFVYDMKNVKSFHNLRSWISELADAAKSQRDGIEENTGHYDVRTNTSPSTGQNYTSGNKSVGMSLRANPYSFQSFLSESTTDSSDAELIENRKRYIKETFGSLPMLIVGNKTDLIQGKTLSTPPNTVQTYGIHSINLSSLKPEMDKLR